MWIIYWIQLNTIWVYGQAQIKPIVTITKHLFWMCIICDSIIKWLLLLEHLDACEFMDCVCVCVFAISNKQSHRWCALFHLLVLCVMLYHFEFKDLYQYDSIINIIWKFMHTNGINILCVCIYSKLENVKKLIRMYETYFHHFIAIPWCIHCFRSLWNAFNSDTNKGS